MDHPQPHTETAILATFSKSYAPVTRTAFDMTIETAAAAATGPAAAHAGTVL